MLPPRRRLGVGALAVAAVALALPVATTGPAAAAPGDGTLTVVVHRDFSGDGVYDAGYDPGQPGVSVTVTDGITVEQRDSGADGAAVFDLATFSGGAFRIDVAIDDPGLAHLQAAPAASEPTADAFRSFTTFVDGSTQTVRVGVWNPATYAQPQPPLALAQQVDRDGDAALRSIMRTDWTNRGPDSSDNEDNTVGIDTLATQSDTGTVFGLAWDRQTRTIYSAAYAKAHTSYGDGGPGAIYRTDADAGTTTLWTTVPDAGSAAHDTVTGHDPAFFLANGREGLGGLALSDDDATLYVVNLNDQALYTYPTAVAAPVAPADRIPIADPGCVGGDWRPFAVTVRDGQVYVGGVCDASASLNRADLVAHVLRLDGSTFAPVYARVLDYLRSDQHYADPVPNPVGADVSTHWNPWRTTWDDDLDDYFTRRMPLYPTPMLTSMQFENDGSLVLAFRDRTSDMLVPNGFAPAGEPAPQIGGMFAAGDLVKACLIGGAYVDEGVGGCPDHSTSETNGGSLDSLVEYFPGDFFLSDYHYGPGVTHDETSLGAVVVAPREPDLANTSMNASGVYNSGGIGPGNDPPHRGLLVAGSESYNFGKANGLGGLTLLADLAPIQIGNRVWLDMDHNGVQDAAATEPGIPGVTVRLLTRDGAELTTTSTDANGEYYFGGEGGYALEPGGAYLVEFDASTVDDADLPAGVSRERLVYTVADAAAGGAEHDSDAVPTAPDALTARVAVTAPQQPGGVDHSIDAGLSPVRVRIEKGDTGSAQPGTIRNDADTAAEAQGYAAGETRVITFDVINDGARPLYDVTITDELVAGTTTIEALACTFPGDGAPTPAILAGTTWTVHWAATFGDAQPAPVAWPPGSSFPCTATLTLTTADGAHVNRARVQTDLAAAGTPGNAPHDGPADSDDYVAFTGDIQVIKYDGEQGDPDVGSGPASWAPPAKPLPAAAQDANTPGDAVTYPVDTPRAVRWVISNTGGTWLADIDLADATSDGPAIGAWTCDLSAVGGPAAYSFGASGPWDGPLAPGASFFCQGPLTLPAGTTHADAVTVSGIVVVPELAPDGTPVLDQDGVPMYRVDDGEPVRSEIVVGDDDPFHAVTPAAPSPTTSPTTPAPTTPAPTTPAPTVPPAPSSPPVSPTPSAPSIDELPATGSSPTGPVLLAVSALAAGALLTLRARRPRQAPPA